MSYKKLYFKEICECIEKYVTESSSGYELLDEITINEIPESCSACQNFLGGYTSVAGIYGDRDVQIKFGSKYAKFEIDDASCNEILADFLNLNNGLVAVDLSNHEHVECTLTVPAMPPDENTHLYENTYVQPVKFDFGTIYFFVSEP